MIAFANRLRSTGGTPVATSRFRYGLEPEADELPIEDLVLIL
jgi:hypothetical protein